MTRWAFPAFAAVMMVLPLLPVPDFWITQSIYVGLYSLVALGLVLLTGVAGLTSFGQAAFVGVGAYAAAYLATQTALPPLVMKRASRRTRLARWLLTQTFWRALTSRLMPASRSSLTFRALV